MQTLPAPPPAPGCSGAGAKPSRARERRAGSRALRAGVPREQVSDPHRTAPTALGEHAAQPRCASAPAFPAGSAASPLLASPSSLCLASLLFPAWHHSFCSLASLLPLPGIPLPPAGIPFPLSAWHSSSCCLASFLSLPGIPLPSTWHPSSLYLASLLPLPGIPPPLDWHPFLYPPDISLISLAWHLPFTWPVLSLSGILLLPC